VLVTASLRLPVTIVSNYSRDTLSLLALNADNVLMTNCKLTSYDNKYTPMVKHHSDTMRVSSSMFWFCVLQTCNTHEGEERCIQISGGET